MLKKIDWFIPLIFLLNFFYKIIFITQNDIALDEPFTIYWAQADFSDLYQMLKGENNPPLYFILLYFWIRLFGIGPLSVRFLPFIFSCLTAVFVYIFGKEQFSKQTGITASLLFTFANYHIFQAHDSRVYSLFALLTVVSSYYFLKSIKNPDNRKYQVIIAISNMLLVYAHFFAWWIIFIQGLSAILIKPIRKTYLKKYIYICVLVWIAYLPYISILWERFSSSASQGTWVQPPVLADLYTMLWRFCNAPFTTVFCLITLVVGYFILIKTKALFDNTAVWFLTIAFWLPYLFMFFISFRVPVYVDKYLVFATIPLYLLLAYFVNYKSSEKKWINYIMSAALIILFIVTSKPNIDNKRRMAEMTEYVKQIKTPQTSVIISPYWLDLSFAYYYNRDYFKDYRHTHSLLKSESIFSTNGPEGLPFNEIENKKAVLFVAHHNELVDAENTIFGQLKKRFPSMEEKDFFDGIKVFYFH